jgi:hypothetical protein
VKPFQHNWISLFQQTTGKTINTHHLHHLTKNELLDSSLSFLLVQDHEPDLVLLVVDIANNNKTILISLHQLTKSSISNESSNFFLQSTLTKPEAQNTIGLHIMKCSEAEVGYECDVHAHGIQISKTEGELNLNFFIRTELK